MQEAPTEKMEDILGKETWSYLDYLALRHELCTVSSPIARARVLLRELVQADPEPKGSAALKIGMLRHLLCQFNAALKVLADATDNRDRHYIQALCWQSLMRFDKAAEEFERAAARGWDDTEIQLRLIEVRALGGQTEQAGEALSKIEEKLSDNADVAYLGGLLAELDGRKEHAVEAYQTARGLQPAHPAATFRLAYLTDLYGEEDEAIRLYRECLAGEPVHAAALLNLAVLYEDAGQYDQAISCLQRILAANPNHARAQLFLKDVEACKTMYYDEDKAKLIAKRNAVLDIPVTDFELSVRARNCLKKMNIRCLGDLVKTTEADLLSYKNFGETSLKEIKDMLTSKGLRLGQALEEEGEYAQADSQEPVSLAESGVLSTPVEQVELSVRARKAIESLGIKTLGELASKTEAELLACRNFGQTSLNEIRQRLADYGLCLREVI